MTAAALGLATAAVLLALFQLGTGEPWHAALSYGYALIVDHWLASLLGAAYLSVVLFVLARMTSR